jgi:putative ABC transport system substrate-binding protein
MKRREFIGLLGGTTVAWPLVARAQQPAMPVLGFLGSESRNSWSAQLRAFREGLSETGYVEGRNLAIEYRWADGRYEQLRTLAAELLGLRVVAIVANGPAVQAAKAATTTTPIIFLTGAGRCAPRRWGGPLGTPCHSAHRHAASPLLPVPR